MKYASDNPITNLLLAGCLVLTLIVTAEWLVPYKADATGGNESAATIDDEIPAGAQPRYVHPHTSNFPAILARPVFFSKRELPPEVVAKAPAPRAPLRLKLEGVAIAADTRVAVLRDQGSKQLVQLSVGMSHNNWQLEEVTSVTATFRRGDDVTNLSLQPENR
jgi:hypothetical protein